MLQTAQHIIERVGKRIGLSDKEIERLLDVDAIHEFEIEMENGNKYKAYRVQHNNRLGPYKGGIRFHPEVNKEEVRALATLMSLKTSAVGLPLGGGKGGVAVDPKTLQNHEIEEVSRKYVRGLHRHIGPEKDIPAPDVNTDAEIIDWMVDEYRELTQDKLSAPAAFTGKSISKGGSEGREAATGRGGVIVLREILKKMGRGKPLTMAVQGFGNVGSFFALIAQQEHPNWKLVAASDSSGAVKNGETGLDAKALDAFKQQGHRLVEYKNDRIQTSPITNDELLALDVDVLVLAALGDAITDLNMESARAKIILELANGPVDETAYQYLTNRNTVIIPDVLANAGGVIVSYLEWLQNRNDEHWSEAEVNKQLEEYLLDATDIVFDTAKKSGVPLKEAAFEAAILRIIGKI